MVPRCFDADIVHSSVKERGGVRKLSEACHCLQVAKENIKCAPSVRENKGKDVKPDEGRVAKELAQLCCKVAGTMCQSWLPAGTLRAVSF